MPQEKYKDEILPLDEIFDSEEKTITLENGHEFKYKYHTRKVLGDNQDNSNNLVVFVPGAECNGENHLSNISQKADENFNSITMQYPEPFNIDDVTEGIRKAIANAEAQNIVLHGSSYGGRVLHKVMSEMDGDSLEQVAGVIYQFSPISKQHLSKTASRIIKVVPTRIVRTVERITRKDTPEGGSSAKGYNDTISTMIAELPDTPEKVDIRYPVKVIVTDNDRLVNGKKLVETISQEANLPESEIGIFVESDKKENYGHTPNNWSDTFLINATQVDEFFRKR